jgi:hypothetical protein
MDDVTNVLGTRSPAFDQACRLERPIDCIRNTAATLVRLAGTLDCEDSEMIVYELALTIQARVEELDAIHSFFSRLHHPDRERIERDGWPDDQAVEELA